MKQTRRHFLASLSATGLTAAGLSAAGRPRPVLAQDALKMTLIVPSPVADVGWSRVLADGARAAADAVGGQLAVLDSISEGPDADRIMQRVVTEGAGVVILGSYGYMNGGLQLARRNPEVSVLHASGYKVAPNFSPFVARIYQATYLMGMAAASLSKTGKLGSVSAYAIPELINAINAFVLGAQSVNPDVEMSVVWVNSWFNPASEREAAKTLISRGCDVLFSNAQDTPSVISLAGERGVYAFNLNSSMKQYAPNHYLGVAGTDWAPFFTAQAEAHLAGKFQGEHHFLGFAEGIVRPADWSPDIPADVMDQIEKRQKAIASGDFNPFTGPIVDTEGTERLAKGESMTVEEIFGMDWHVEGVVTPLPK